VRVDIFYNATGQPHIPAAGVAHLSGNTPARAGTGYDRNWPARRACRHPDCVPNDSIRATMAERRTCILPEHLSRIED
jgi:hypothetical protein